MQKKWLRTEVSKLNLKIQPKYNVILRDYTTFKIGGKCDMMLVPSAKDEYLQILNWCYDRDIKFRVLGAGSNILIDSAGIDGVVISTKNLDKIVIDATNILAECGARLPVLALQTMNNDIGGFEFCSGIPGSVGGAVVGNAGAFGSDMANVVESVTFWKNGKVQKQKNEKILFNYRKSVFKNDTSCAIIEVDMRGHREDRQVILDKMKKNREYRTLTQNVMYPNAGCVFNNTEISPAVMIEKSNLKGYRVGDAMISHKHSNFIVNLGNATSSEVLQLIENVKNKIYRDWGKELKIEISYWSK